MAMCAEAAIDEVLEKVPSVQIGPDAKEYNLLRAEEEYESNNEEHSIYYQVKSMFHGVDMRFVHEPEKPTDLSRNITKISDTENFDYNNSTFFKNIKSYQEKIWPPKNAKKPTNNHVDFFMGICEPKEGLEKIKQVCQQLPDEWCVLQLCKSFNPANTYSRVNDIAASSGYIYMTLLRHCRSSELGPICLRFDNALLPTIFKQYSTLVDRYRSIVTVDHATVKDQKVKAKYWKNICEFNDFLTKLIENLGKVIRPYACMFLGKRYSSLDGEKSTKLVFQRVDKYCKKLKWSSHQRVLLSQACLHANRMSDSELVEMSYELTKINQSNSNLNETELQLVQELLRKCAKSWQRFEDSQPLAKKRYPVILVVDERLDHMHWEQLAPEQDFTRFRSLHSLFRLYNYHKPNIKSGYYAVHVERGVSVINPDGDLKNSGRRLRSFMEYWLSHWQHTFEKVPTEKFMTEQAFKADCFVYAGHGSTLQYISSSAIYRNLIKSVAFLFGCDSVRPLPTGLHSSLYGAQDYYHGALCPTVVGTLMPALDGNMDNVSAHILSRWIAPANRKVVPWTCIDRAAWITQGTIKAQAGSKSTMSQALDYQVGSLSAILSHVHLGKVEPKIYNYCIYVCRGLPAWNLAIEKLPTEFSSKSN
ncbi:Sse [Drosophila busckii]|uniref:separase n=1 Tax=Drosophila busckii TaxID=30019 RepID=A0A0M5J7W6_DROBS|nr:separin [Drosophila busckii]ALC43161.1 Sse [Drosophila busckii]